MNTAGFHAVTGALDLAAADLSGDADRLAAARSHLVGQSVPVQAFGLSAQSQRAAAAHADSLRRHTAALDASITSTRRIGTGVRVAVANYRHGDAEVSRSFHELLGGGSGSAGAKGSAAAVPAPFAERIAAHRQQIQAALDAEKEKLAGYRAELADSPSDQDLREKMAKSQARIELYENVISENRQILSFDPSKDGSMVELVGGIDGQTRNVAVFVPGTFSELANFERYRDIADGFVQASPKHDLAVVVWMDGDLPSNLFPQAPSAGYANDLAPRLAGFSHELRTEIAASAAAGNDVQITYAGHSYGGAVVGSAEEFGLDANRMLHVESAGMGHYIDNPDDLHSHHPDVRRYSMTAPGDPITWVRDVNLGNWGHGADPDEFPGVVRLETGDYPDGRPLQGLSAHTDVFTYHSDAWWNIYQVFTGGAVVPVASTP